MKKTRALTLLLAVSMLLSLFPVMTSAASDYNYIKIEEEVIVENGNFDKKPEVKNYSKKAYKDIPEGAWGLIPKGDSAKAKYVTEGDNSFLRIEAENNIPTVAYRIGAVEAGSYTLTFDIRRNTTPADAMNRIYLRVFNLDESFKEASNAAAMVLSGVTVNPGVPQSDDWTTLYFAIELTESADLAFDFFTKSGGNDAYITGTLDVDNVSLARPTDILIESADLDAVENTTAYNSVTDIPVNKWVSSAVDYMTFKTDGEYLQVANKNDKIATNPTVMYAFEDPLAPGDYRLTLVIDTADTESGWMSIVGSVQNAKISSNVKDVAASPYTYTAEFTVPAGDSIPVGFRYWSNDGVVPAEPFSIVSMKLEKDSGTETLTEHTPITIIKNSSTDSNNPFVIDTTKNDTTGTVGKWSLKDKDYATLSLDGGVLKYEDKAADDNKQPNLVYNMGTLEAGNYTIKLDIKMNGGRPSGQQFEVKYPGTSIGTLAYFDPAPWVTSTPISASVSFNLAEQTNNCVFRFYPHNNGKNIKYIYTVDNFSVVKTASYSTEWTTIESYDFTTPPTIYSAKGIHHNDLLKSEYAGNWVVHLKSFGAVYFEHDTTNNCLKVVRRDSAICGQPKVMYKFSNTLSKGDYGIEILVNSYAADWDMYTYKVVDATTGADIPGAVMSNVELRQGEKGISINFSLESDHNVALVIEHVSRDSRTYINAYDIKCANLNKLSNPLIQLRSNADLATFDSDEGVYYMAVNAQRDIYLNYFANTDVRSGQYMLSAEFKTAADRDVQLFANFGTMDLDVNTIQAGDEWQHIEYPVTLKKDTALSISNGIRFKVNSTAPLYMRNLKLVFVENLPKPAINAAITMILLKKIEGTYAGHISTKPVEYAVNGGFDTEIKIDHEQSRAYLKHEDGRWSYSKNSGDVKTSIVKDGASSYAYFEVANANPTVGHRIGTLPAGSYTLSFDIYPEYNIGSIRTRIWKLTDGFAVSKSEYVIADNTASIKVGANNTITYNFVLTEETTVAFNFYATKENPCPEKGNFRLDNVSVTGRP